MEREGIFKVGNVKFVLVLLLFIGVDVQWRNQLIKEKKKIRLVSDFCVDFCLYNQIDEVYVVVNQLRKEVKKLWKSDSDLILDLLIRKKLQKIILFEFVFFKKQKFSLIIIVMCGEREKFLEKVEVRKNKFKRIVSKFDEFDQEEEISCERKKWSDVLIKNFGELKFKLRGRLMSNGYFLSL